MLGRIIKGIAYSVYFVVALVGFIYLSLPTDKLKGYIEHHASQKLKMQLTIGGLELRGITGVTLTGVQLVIPIKPLTDSAAGAPGGPGSEPAPLSTSDDGASLITDPPGLLNAAELNLDVNTIGLIRGHKLKAALTGDLSNGEIKATMEATDGGFLIELEEISGVNLAPVRLFRWLLKMDVHSMLSGRVSLDWGGHIAKSSGKLDLVLSDTVVPYLSLGQGERFMGEAFEVQVGALEVEAELGKPEDFSGIAPRLRSAPAVLLISKLDGRGEHIELQLDAAQKHWIAFTGPKNSDGEIDLKFMVHFTEEFFAWEGDGHRADGTLVEDVSHAGFKMAFANMLRAARVRSGGKYYYGFHCRGPLSSFKCLPEAPSRRISPNLGGTPVSAGATSGRPGARPPPAAGAAPLARPQPPGRSVSRPGTTRPSTARPSTTRPSTARPSTTRSRPPRASKSSTRPAGRLVERTRPQSERRTRPARVTPPPMLGGGGEPTPTVNEEPEIVEDHDEGDEEDEDDEYDDEEDGEEGEDFDEEDTEGEEYVDDEEEF